MPRGHNVNNTVDYFYKIIIKYQNVQNQTSVVESMHCSLTKIELSRFETDNVIEHNVYQHRSLF